MIASLNERLCLTHDRVKRVENVRNGSKADIGKHGLTVLMLGADVQNLSPSSADPPSRESAGRFGLPRARPCVGVILFDGEYRSRCSRAPMMRQNVVNLLLKRIVYRMEPCSW
ncbi:MAG: hypothetical protein LH610_06650 [Sphingomonas bacterium]|nr:hypothetical protein [Sphingomonas bacterium]